MGKIIKSAARAWPHRRSKFNANLYAPSHRMAVVELVPMMVNEKK
jgi:hypothetical protein